MVKLRNFPMSALPPLEGVLSADIWQKPKTTKPTLAPMIMPAMNQKTQDIFHT
jgi:hypothetical protein